jgi:asparagine synthase (glutamine-hydrolysing)
MNTKFLGAFTIDKSKETQFSNVRNSDIERIIKLDEQFSFTVGNERCFVWGYVYDLSKSCKDLGIDKTENPAEAIFKAVKNDSPEKVDAFYGEFTYLYFSDDQVILGRDHVGAGLPVFYTDKLFGNNIDDFKLDNSFSFQLDEETLKAFLHMGSPIPPRTMVKGVNQLAPGEFLVWKNGNISTGFLFPYEKYEKLFASLKIDEKEAAKELERLHKASIKRRIEGKKNVALLMSGGYDSGGNVAALRDLYDGQVSGYSIGFKDDQWSELPLAAFLAKEFNIDFHDYLIDGSEIDELPIIMRNLAFPFQENGVMVNYTVMKRVNQDANDMILGGDGNDQVYGTGMQQVALHYLTAKYGLKPFQKILSGMLAGSNHSKLSRIHFHNVRILNAADFTSFGFSKSEIKNFLKSPGTALETNLLKLNKLKVKGFDGLFMAHTYFKDFMNDGNGLIIFKASNMARLFGQQLSFPYMDKDSTEFVMSLPRELRFSGSVKDIAKGHGKSKFLHKSYLYPKLPKEITERKKQGGFAPLPKFFQDENRRKQIYQIIKKSDITKELFVESKLNDFISDYESICNAKDAWFWHQQSMAFRLFNLITLTIWWEIHFNNKPGDLLKDFS